MTKKRQPYRSSKRDQPRILGSHINPSSTNANPISSETTTGSLTYRAKGPSLMDIFQGSIQKSDQLISTNFSEEIMRIESSLNYQYELASHYVWLIDSPIAVNISEVNDVLLPCFHKSMIGLTTAFHLNKQGLWGAARPLIRHTFESLIIAKYCSVNNDSEIFDKWVDGIDIYFTNGLLKKIKNPATDEFSRFWGVMSDFSHSTAYALQPDFNVNDHKHDISVNFGFIEMMLECKYHLLISHLITNEMKYYQARYKNQARARELRKLLTANYSKSKKGMAKAARRLIKDYRCSWVVDLE
ncbi:MAG: hypothetical protein ACRBB4_10880 [Neptuniibacter sp.]